METWGLECSGLNPRKTASHTHQVPRSQTFRGWIVMLVDIHSSTSLAWPRGATHGCSILSAVFRRSVDTTQRRGRERESSEDFRWSIGPCKSAYVTELVPLNLNQDG